MSYQELLRDRSSVAHLLKHVNALEKGSESASKTESWIAPPDNWKVRSAHSVLAKVDVEGDESQEEAGEDTSTVVSGATALTSETRSSATSAADGAAIPKELQINTLTKLQKSILARNGIPLETKGTSLITSSQNLSSKKVMVDLRPEDMSYPDTEGIPPCPDMAELERAFYNKTLNIEVHNIEGYSFTSEFELVYKGKTSNESAFGDFITICQRTFLTMDPTFDDEIGVRYAKMIARMCLWERSIAAEVCAKALQTTVPHLNAEMQMKEPYAPLKIFIGQDRSTGLAAADSIRVWIRYCPRIQPRDMDNRAGADVRKAEKKAHIAMQLCSYRCVQLSKDRVEEFEQWCAVQVETPAAKMRTTKRKRYIADRERKMAGKKRKPLESEPSTAFPAPPLPTKTFPPQPSQWSLHLFCRQNFKAGANDDASELYDDEDEEAQVWSVQALVGTAEADQSQVQSSDASVTSGNASMDTRETLRRRIARALASDPSACSELIGWGHDTDHSLGIGGATRAPSSLHENIHTPRPLPIPASLALERVKSIACGARHTLVLTCLGNVYVCGENSEGALGLGDMRSRSVLTLLQWPMDTSGKRNGGSGGSATMMDAPPRIAKVAAGCGPIGSHSMCIDADGLLYGWGVPQAVGLGSVQPVLAPRLIDTFPRPLLGRHDESGGIVDGTGDGASVPNNLDLDDETALGGPPCALRVADVACGGGFTVCILRDDGRVCSWGTWQHGRLGQGPTPTIKAARGYGSGDKLARYKLRPAYVRGIRRAVKVSCGEAHTLCVLQSGEVKAWGQNSCGQLGFGPNNMGYLRDSLRPVTVPPFFGSTDGPGAAGGSGRAVMARSVCAGPYHSCVVDSEGGLWTFGGRGSACLGHNDAFLSGEWADRLSSIFAIATNALQIMIPFELLAWVRVWSVPRRVLALSRQVVEQVAAGDQATCVLTADGHFLVCGSGAVSPPIVSASLEQDSMREIEKQFGDTLDEESEIDDEQQQQQQQLEEEEEEEEGHGGEDNQQGDSLLARAKARHERRRERKSRLERRRAEEHAKLIADRALIVKTFRRPSASWLPELSGRRVLLVASGGTRGFAVMDEENVAATLTSSLLKSTIRPSGRGAAHDDDDDEDEGGTDLDSQADTLKSVGSYFDVRGRADCILLVSGKMILCHRAILASRSGELRDMIVQETPSDDYSAHSAYYSQQPTQLLLPELHVDSARALLSFIYTDILPTNCIGNVSMLQSLQRVSRSLRLPRLQVVTERLLDNLTAAEMARNDDLINVDASTFGAQKAVGAHDMPSPTLARDLGTLVGDAEYADVRFIAEGRPIPAHRFILESRCDYFKAMFRFQPGSGGADGSISQSAASTAAGMVDVVVPDTFVAFLRLLIFIYTDTLPDGNDEALLEDLLSADRYDLRDMKTMCESMLVPSSENWLGILKVAELVRSASLMDQVHAYLRDNFSTLNDMADVGLFDGGVHSDKEGTYLQFLRREYPSLVEEIFQDRIASFPPPPSQVLVTKMEANHAALDSANNAPPFPIWALLIGGVAAFLYAQSATIISLGPVVPFVNSLFLIGALIWGYRRIFYK